MLLVTIIITLEGEDTKCDVSKRRDPTAHWRNVTPPPQKKGILCFYSVILFIPWYCLFSPANEAHPSTLDGCAPNHTDAPGYSSRVSNYVALLNIHDVFTGQAWLPCLLFGHDSATQSRTRYTSHVVLCGFHTSWPVVLQPTAWLTLIYLMQSNVTEM